MQDTYQTATREGEVTTKTLPANPPHYNTCIYESNFPSIWIRLIESVWVRHPEDIQSSSSRLGHVHHYYGIPSVGRHHLQR